MAEGGGGVISGSLALLADAGHNLGDVLGLALSWGAAVLRRRPTQRFTYGLRSRLDPHAALASAIILLVVTGGIALGGGAAAVAPGPVAGATVAWVAAVGILVNGVTALLFGAAGRSRDLNVKAPFFT